MAPGSHPRHAQPGTAIRMPLGTPSNKGPHTKRCMRSSPHHSFRQAHRERPSDDDNILHGFFPSGSSQSSQTCKLTRSVKIISIPPVPLASTVPRLQLRSFVIESAFVGTNAHVEAKTWLLCLGSSSRLLYKRVLVTQGVSCISPTVALDKTPSTSRKKFSIGASHLEHPQSIEFDADRALEKPDLI